MLGVGLLDVRATGLGVSWAWDYWTSEALAWGHLGRGIVRRQRRWPGGVLGVGLLDVRGAGLGAS